MNNDLISRSALLKEMRVSGRAAYMIVQEAPAVDAGPKWISVKDALPEESEFVLCSMTGRYKNVAYESAYVIGTYYADEGWILEEAPRWENPPVTHWMPLPEPPKEV